MGAFDLDEFPPDDYCQLGVLGGYAGCWVLAAGDGHSALALLDAGAKAPPLSPDLKASEAVLAVLRRRLRAG